MQASGSPSVEGKRVLRTTIASHLGISEVTGIKNFDVSFVDADQRRLLTGGTWFVTFDVVTDIYSAADTTTSAVTVLNNATFQAELQSEIPGIESFEIASAFEKTRNPSPAPTVVPTAFCTPGTYLDVASGTCVVCDAGKYAVNENLPWATECSLCAAGKFANQTSSSACTVCFFLYRVQPNEAEH